MTKRTLGFRAAIAIFAAMLILFSSTMAAGHKGEAPQCSEPTKNLRILGNEKVSIELSNLSNGIVNVRYDQPNQPCKLKVTIDKGDERYVYDLQSDGEFEPLPLQMGDGKYSVRVLSNVVANKYAVIYGTTLDVQLSDEMAPFLASSQLVKFSENSKAVELAEKLSKDAETDKDKLEAIYKYIVNNITYDWDKAATVKPGYLPDCDEILELGKGICFDYAALFAAMLRSVNVPAKLVTGYVAPDYLYHAWNEAYIEGTGWIRVNRFYSTYKEDQGWIRMDPTFAASAKTSSKTADFIDTEGNYRKSLEY